MDLELGSSGPFIGFSSLVSGLILDALCLLSEMPHLVIEASVVLLVVLLIRVHCCEFLFVFVMDATESLFLSVKVLFLLSEWMLVVMVSLVPKMVQFFIRADGIAFI